MYRTIVCGFATHCARVAISRSVWRAEVWAGGTLPNRSRVIYQRKDRVRALRARAPTVRAAQLAQRGAGAHAFAWSGTDHAPIARIGASRQPRRRAPRAHL